MAKTVLITGSSSGFGKATALLFLQRGWNVVATMRSPDASIFGEASDNLHVVALDVTKPTSVSQAIQQGIERFGAIDVLINNAGIVILSALEVTPEDRTRDIFETNTFGPIRVIQEIIPHMRTRGSGTIINVTSSTGIAPMPLVAVYTASKMAMEGLAESLSYELGMLGIQVKLVEPGYAPTTSLVANGAERMEGLISEPYQAFAESYWGMLANYPTAYTTESDVAETIYTAATDGTDRVRYPAGPDTQMLAALRWSNTDEVYMAKMREMFGPAKKAL
jgi:NAD(P)-dependent dehydrogenase (short-subunit alcohol dehydrogenase family)